MANNYRAFSYFGDIALINFSDKTPQKEKKDFANKVLKENKSVKTVLEKSGMFKGRLRKMQTKHLAGEKNKEVLYKENNCTFRFDIDSTYFSPRLSNERKELANLI
ncbi:class I SAM-dependent methyltransferase family protein, partial [Candidatus Pacearchaeota archaeon]|nr:class I SAM-dependent methyltransferase family protein [Candidatus Pacearchaeota archaeon]